MSPDKKFLETLSFVLPAKTTEGLIVERTVVLAGRTKLRVSKNFLLGNIFLYLLNIFATAPSKLKKNIKNYSSILAIVNHRNWLNDSLPLSSGTQFRLKLEIVPLKFSRKNTNNFYLRVIKDYFRAIRFPNSLN